MRTSRLLLASSILSLSLSAGCDPVTPTEDSGPGTDTGGTDTGGVMTDTGETPTDAGSDGGGGTGCGTARPDVAAIRGTEGLIIARDGTIYYSQSGAVGRLAPGGSPQNSFVALSGADTVWGIALDAANETLYVGSPTTGSIYSVDLTAATPTATVFASGVGSPNGLTVGPDGALYFSDFGGSRVRRVAATGGAPTNVTTSAISQANGVAFDAEGRLLVASYATGTLFRLTLTAGAETGRETVATGLGSPDGVAVDANGDYWVTNNGAGALLAVDATTGVPMNALPGISSAASLDFGAGPLNCQDIYIASGGAMRRYEASGVDGADVLWH
jgi:hypothetical protein